MHTLQLSQRTTSTSVNPHLLPAPDLQQNGFQYIVFCPNIPSIVPQTFPPTTIHSSPVTPLHTLQPPQTWTFTSFSSDLSILGVTGRTLHKIHAPNFPFHLASYFWKVSAHFLARTAPGDNFTPQISSESFQHPSVFRTLNLTEPPKCGVQYSLTCLFLVLRFFLSYTKGVVRTLLILPCYLVIGPLQTFSTSLFPFCFLPI